MEAKKEKAKADELQKQEDEQQRMIKEFEKPPPDECHGFRIHSWVVVLPDYSGPRGQEILAPFFIEPSSGVSCSPTDLEANLLYLGVESIWNDRNYWVNIQSCSEGCAGINWDLTKNKFWEHLLPGEPWTMRGVDDTEEEEIEIQREKHLDMPGSYVDKIEIHSLDFERRYPNGKKTTFYKKAKVEQIAPYFNISGLIERVTLYDDYEYTIPIKVYEKFINRGDNLFKSTKEMNSKLVTDFYNRGRPDACKEHHYYSKLPDRVDDERIIEYYDAVRLDGLSKIKMHRNYLFQDYKNRDDFLFNREVHFTTDKGRKDENDIHYREIVKIIERYHRNEKIPASQNIAVKEFAIVDNEIRLKYHYDKGNYTRATRTFVKPSMADRGERLVFNPEMVFEYNPDPMAPPEKTLILFYDLKKQLEDEQQSTFHVRDAELEINRFIQTKNEEHMMPKLSVSVFDRNRNEKARAEILEQEETLRAESQRDTEVTVDLLAPYIESLGNPSTLTKEQAFKINEQFLNDFKQSQVDRANYMLRMLNHGNQELQKLQANLIQTDGLQVEEKEKLRIRLNEMNIYLHTLEERLNRHRDLVPERYRQTVNVLREDPRMAILREYHAYN
ncbi:dynein regulatory complex subunit 7-like [Belonocnema kinseyi]|uniref:dynein regulatory complex subunit 7-like n=1 Tax=Belonocnema kinseyi TaxID=2817044 RepID=UPI00143DCB44|nr:dynein regulatory complex subunit 7-like [Belonocnema kinseyi]